MSVAITAALRVAMAEQWARHVAETSAGCRAVLSAAVGDSGTPPARVLLRCVLAPHDGPAHETVLPDGTRAPFEVPR